MIRAIFFCFCLISPILTIAQSVGERMYTFVNQTTEVIDHIEVFPPSERGSYNLLAEETFNTLNPYGNKMMKMPEGYRDKCAFIVLAFDRKGNRYEIPTRDYCFFAGWIEFKVEHRVVSSSRREEGSSRERAETEERDGISIRLPNVNLRIPRRETSAPRTENAAPNSGFVNKAIENESTVLIDAIYLVPAKRDSSIGWAENLIENPLKPEQSTETIISSGDGCYYDLKVVAPFYKPYERRNINLCRSAKITLLDEHFEKDENVVEATFDNRTGRKIDRFYLKPSADTTWSEDQLESLVVSADGRFLTLMFQKGENCVLDIKVRSGRNEIVTEKADLCAGVPIVIRNP